MHVIDHLDIESGSSIFPSMHLGSGDGHLFCFTSRSTKNSWSVSTWHDYDRDARNLVMFVDLDLRGPGFGISVGYVGLILLSIGALAWMWWRGRHATVPTGGFEVRPTGQPHNQPMGKSKGTSRDITVL
jgi:hypothetical protein